MNCQRQGHASWEKSKCNSWEQKFREREALWQSLLYHGAEIEREFWQERRALGEGTVATVKATSMSRAISVSRAASTSRKRRRAEYMQEAEVRRPHGHPRWNEGEVPSSQVLVSSFFQARDQGGERGGEDSDNEEMDIESTGAGF